MNKYNHEAFISKLCSISQGPIVEHCEVIDDGDNKCRVIKYTFDEGTIPDYFMNYPEYLSTFNKPLNQLTDQDKRDAQEWAKQDERRMAGWRNDHWHYIIISVDLYVEGVKIARDSLGGIEDDSGVYLKEVELELTANCYANMEAGIKEEIAACRARLYNLQDHLAKVVTH